MAQPRRLHDQYFKKAKAEGYLARSAYKLQEIQERFKVMGRSARVLDLGCAPGSWLQVAAEVIGPGGRIVGIDLAEVREKFGPNVTVVRGDVNTVAGDALTSPAGGPFDTVLSDMAPNTSGSGDDALSARLCGRVLDLLPQVLRPGGNLVMKILEGSDYPDVLRRTASMFREGRGFKPKASRDVSREMYILGRGFLGAANAPAPPGDRTP